MTSSTVNCAVPGSPQDGIPTTDFGHAPGSQTCNFFGSPEYTGVVSQRLRDYQPGSDSEGTQDYPCTSDSEDTQYYGKSNSTNMCSGCGASDALRLCSGCRVARYCNSFCRGNHWHNGHDVYCLHLRYTRKLWQQARARVYQEVDERLERLRATQHA